LDIFYKRECLYKDDNKHTAEAEKISDEIFRVKQFDNNIFETFGIICNKILYLTNEEVVYLCDINYIRLIEYNDNTLDLKLSNNILYNYLRRAGKIVTW